MHYLFISFLNRSGSSFFLNELSKYSTVFVCPESGLMQHLLLNKPYAYSSPLKYKISKLISTIELEKLDKWNIKLDDLLKQIGSEKNIELFFTLTNNLITPLKETIKLVVFKDNNLIHTFGKLDNKYLEKNKIFHISLIRDPRAIFYSQKSIKNSFRHTSFTNNPLVAAYAWNNFYRQSKTLNAQHFILKYEDIIMQTDDCIQKILKKIGIIIHIKDNTTGYYFDLIPKQLQSMHNNILNPPLKNKIDNWENKLDMFSIQIIENICRTSMIEMGYNTITKHRTGLIYLFLLLYFKLRIFFKIDRYYSFKPDKKIRDK